MANEFDIYQTESGYTAVTSDVRRQILDGLAERDLRLGDLVELTGKSKPTLSSVHMKELLAQQLVDERTDPEDSRKKIYRLAGRKVGSSNLPVAELRTAVKHYVSLSPLAARISVAVALESLAAAPAETPAQTLRRQAHHLGRAVSGWFVAPDAKNLAGAVRGFLEQEGLAAPIDEPDSGDVVAFAPGPAFPSDVAPDRVGVLLAGLLEGIAATRGVGEDTISVRSERLDGGRRVRIELPVQSKDDVSG